MCGFFYSLGDDSIDIDESLIDNYLINRGPDAKGVFRNKREYLHHRRLAIIDLEERSNQPMRRGEITIMFNGEIYNYKEIKGEIKDFEYKTNSDTEVIIAAYKRWGLDCFKHFRGMFAILIIDRQKRKVIIARDHLGVKPLYYFIKEGITLKVSSDIRCITKTMRKDISISSIGAISYFIDGYCIEDETIVDSVYSILPGSYITFELNNIKSINKLKYWNIPKVEDGKKDYEEIRYNVDKLLYKAVSRRLNSDVEPVVALSSGIDSSLIAYYSSILSKRSIKSVTVKTIGNDESYLAREFANSINIDNIILKGNSNEYKNIEILENMPYPLGDNSYLPTHTCFEGISELSKVCISGDGADEIFAGYSHYEIANSYIELNNSLNKRRFPRKLFKYTPRRNRLDKLRMLQYKDPMQSYTNLLSRFLRIEEIVKLNIFLGISQKELLEIYEVYLKRKLNIIQEIKEYHPNSETKELFPIYDLLTYLPGDILRKVDMASMENSVEARSPFLDIDLVNYSISSIPYKMKREGSVGKILLRTLLKEANIKGNQLSKLTKKGFMANQAQTNKLSSNYIKHKLVNKELNNSGKNIIKLKEITKYKLDSQTKKLFLVASWNAWHNQIRKNK